jgi:hypothetical protein
MEKQFKAHGLSAEESSQAYAALKEHFNLRARQRDMLDVSPSYSATLNAAHRQDWATALALLIEAGIVDETAAFLAGWLRF